MPEESNRPQEGYEKSDMRLRVVMGFATIFVVLTVGALVVTMSVLSGMESRRAPLTQGQPPAEALQRATDAAARPPLRPDRPGPLEQSPRAERIAVTAPDFQRLDAYGVASETPRRLHVPVSKAIELIAEGTAPYRAGAVDDGAPQPGER